MKNRLKEAMKASKITKKIENNQHYFYKDMFLTAVSFFICISGIVVLFVIFN